MVQQEASVYFFIHNGIRICGMHYCYPRSDMVEVVFVELECNESSG